MTILERDKSACERLFETRTEPISIKFVIGETIARGKFGIVKKLTDRESGKEYAGKFVRIQEPDKRGDVHREANLLSEVCHHKFIIGLEMFYTTPKTEMVIVMELALNGDIFDYCVGDRKKFTEDESRELTRQLAHALDFIHSKHIVHLDIKPQNILLSKDGSCKLADFGLSRKVLPGQIVQEICGTPEYTAPEILNYNPITTAADIWSLGTVLYVMLTGFSPFAGDTIQETYLNVATASLSFPDEDWCHRSKYAIELIEALCTQQPSERMTASKVLEQKWLKQNEAPTEKSSRMTVKANITTVQLDANQPIVRRRTRRSRKQVEEEVKQFVQNNQSGDSDSGVSLADEDGYDSNRTKDETTKSITKSATTKPATPVEHTLKTEPSAEKTPDFFARREMRRKQYLLKLSEANQQPTTVQTT